MCWEGQGDLPSNDEPPQLPPQGLHWGHSRCALHSPWSPLERVRCQTPPISVENYEHLHKMVRKLKQNELILHSIYYIVSLLQVTWTSIILCFLITYILITLTKTMHNFKSTEYRRYLKSTLAAKLYKVEQICEVSLLSTHRWLAGGWLRTQRMGRTPTFSVSCSRSFSSLCRQLSYRIDIFRFSLSRDPYCNKHLIETATTQ